MISLCRTSASLLYSVALGSLLLPGLVGCSGEPLPVGKTPLPSEAELPQVLARGLNEELEFRRLDVRRHAAWQVLHGVLAYGDRFPLVVADGEQPALAYLLGGGSLEGWQFVPGETIDGQRRGLRAVLQAGSKRGQGHHDQWLAILSQCNLPPSQTIRIDGQDFTMADLVWQVQRDVHRNFEQEYSWTLIGLSQYIPMDATWEASDGSRWNMDRLLQIELQHDLNTSACGGTHRLMGIATAVRKKKEQSPVLQGVWQEAEQRLALMAERAQELQNPDGSFSIHFFQRPGSSPEVSGNLAATGHILEFLAMSLPAERLGEPWVERAVVRLCTLLDQTRQLDLECGALYHAVHGLVLYQQRRFGQ